MRTEPQPSERGKLGDYARDQTDEVTASKRPKTPKKPPTRTFLT